MANEPRFEVYKQHRENEPIPAEYGWRFRAGNGQISAIGGEGFTRVEDAERAIGQFLTHMAEIPVKEIGDLDPIILHVDD